MARALEQYVLPDGRSIVGVHRTESAYLAILDQDVVARQATFEALLKELEEKFGTLVPCRPDTEKASPYNLSRSERCTDAGGGHPGWETSSSYHASDIQGGTADGPSSQQFVSDGRASYARRRNISHYKISQRDKPERNPHTYQERHPIDDRDSETIIESLQRRYPTTEAHLDDLAADITKIVRELILQNRSEEAQQLVRRAFQQQWINEQQLNEIVQWIQRK